MCRKKWCASLKKQAPEPGRSSEIFVLPNAKIRQISNIGDLIIENGTIMTTRSEKVEALAKHLANSCSSSNPNKNNVILVSLHYSFMNSQ